MTGITLLILLVIMVLFLLLALTKKSLLKSAVALACASVMLTIILFILAAPWGAVFELSVCAGLITVVFISTISMTDAKSKREDYEERKLHNKKFAPLFIILAVVVAATAYFLSQQAGIVIQGNELGYDFKEVLWNTRQTDIVGQIVLVLAAVFGITVFFKEVD